MAAERILNFRSVLRCPGGDERDGAFGADVRFHRGARPCLGSRRKRGQHDQALGRSRGGFSTKIHLKTDFGGLPIAFHLTGGEASDSRNFETLLDIGPDLNPRAALGDKGYDSKSNRDAARQRGICPAIPYRSNTKDMPAFFPKTLYKAQARIEHFPTVRDAFLRRSQKRGPLPLDLSCSSSNARSEITPSMAALIAAGSPRASSG